MIYLPVAPGCESWLAVVASASQPVITLVLTVIGTEITIDFIAKPLIRRLRRRRARSLHRSIRSKRHKR